MPFISMGHQFLCNKALDTDIHLLYQSDQLKFYRTQSMDTILNLTFFFKHSELILIILVLEIAFNNNKKQQIAYQYQANKLGNHMCILISCAKT